MSNALTLPKDFGAPVDYSAKYGEQDRLGEGVSSGYAIVGYKGKVWSIRFAGNDTPLMADFNGQQIPLPSLPVVIVRAAPNLSKTYYPDGYVEGSNAAPTCLSDNGITPAAHAPAPQCASCAVCPHNKFYTSPKTGKPVKDCQDFKKLAVLPLDDLENEAYGGAMMLRVPAGSLKSLDAYGRGMSQIGFPYYFMYGTRISFDTNESFPKFMFNPIRKLTEGEQSIVDRVRDDPETLRLFGREASPVATSAPQLTFEQDPNASQQTVANKAPQTIDGTAVRLDKIEPTIAAQAAAEQSVIDKPDADTPATVTDDFDEELDTLMAQ